LELISDLKKNSGVDMADLVGSLLRKSREKVGLSLDDAGSIADVIPKKKLS